MKKTFYGFLFSVGILVFTLFLLPRLTYAYSCPVPAPTNVQLTTSGNMATVKWTAVTGVSVYEIRVNDNVNYWTDNCSSLAPGDRCFRDIKASSFSFSYDSTKQYNIWVHAQVDSTCGAGVSNISLGYPLLNKVGGFVKTPSGSPIQNVQVKVTDRNTNTSQTVATNTSGYYVTTPFISPNHLYDVTIPSTPIGYTPATTSTGGWVWDWCKNSNIYTPLSMTNPKTDVPVGSSAYTCQKLSTTVECGGYSNDPKDYRKDRCNFTLTPTSEKTVILGRVTDLSQHYWQTTSTCGSGYNTSPATMIKFERFNLDGTVAASSLLNISSCNPQPYYTSGYIPAAKRRITLVGIPAGYMCSDWMYSRYDSVQKKWIDVKASSGGLFDKSTCSVKLDTMQLYAPYDNSHHIWFVIKPAVTPTIVITPTVKITPTIPTISCNIVPTDIQIVIDRSSSMWKNSATDSQGIVKTKLQWAQAAALSFVDKFANTGAASRGIIRIGVTSFMGNMSGTTSTSFIPTSNFNQVRNWINSIPATSTGTCISCGEKAAQSSLSAAGQNDGKTTRKVVVFLSDGRANHMITNADLNKDGSINETDAGYEAIRLADDSRTADSYLHYVVGFGSSGSPVRTWVLKGDNSSTSPYPDTGIANVPASTYYRYDQDPFDWTTLFNQTQDDICRNTTLRAN